MSDPDVVPRWPILSYEEVAWEAEPAMTVSRAARRRAREPYRAAVPYAVAERAVPLATEMAALVENAAEEIARFDTELGAEIAPFAAVLLRSESAASSQIENLTAGARAIAEAELSGYGSRNATAIVANQAAMNAAIDLADDISPATILAMHRALLERSDPVAAGRWRTEQVWIGGGYHSPHEAAFIPPRHERVPAAIDDLIAFVDRDDIPVLAHAAIAHAQFETIHPFTDGNGRTGRALVHAQLRNKGLTRNVTVPLSAGLLTDTDAYFAALTSYRAGDTAPIIERFAVAAFAAVDNGRTLATDLRAIRAGWRTRIAARRSATVWRVADLLVRHPVVNAVLLGTELGIQPRNSYRALGPLVDAGVLVETTDKKRNRHWRAPEILDALDQFAARAGRRTRASGPAIGA